MSSASFTVKVADGTLEQLLAESGGALWTQAKDRLLWHYARDGGPALEPLLRKMLVKASKAAGEALIPFSCVVSRYDNERARSALHSHRFGQVTLPLGASRPMLVGESAVVLRAGKALYIEAGVSHGLPEQQTACLPQVQINLYVATRTQASSPPLSACLIASARQGTEQKPKPLQPASEFCSFRWVRPSTLDEALRPTTDIWFDLWSACRDALGDEGGSPPSKRAKLSSALCAPQDAPLRAPSTLPPEWGVDAKVAKDFAGLSPAAREVCLRRLQKIFDGPRQVQNLNSYCSSVIRGVGDTFGMELRPEVREALCAKLAGSGWTLEDLDSSAAAALAGLPQESALGVVNSLWPATVSNLSAFVAGAAKKQSATCPVGQALRSGWDAVARAFAATRGELSSQVLVQVIRMACASKKPEPFGVACAALARFPAGCKPPLSTYNNIFKAAGHARRWPVALELFSQLPAHLQPNRYTYTALIDAVVRGGGPQTLLWALWHDMHRQCVAVLADQQLMSTLLQGCSEPIVADEILAELEWQGAAPSIELLTSVVGCYRRAGAPTGKTWDVLKLAKQHDLALDCQFLVQVVTALGYAHDTGSVVLLIESAREVYRVQPDVFLYTASISQCARAGDLAGAETILRQMRQDGVEPNEHTHCAIIAAYSKSGHLSRAVEYFEELTRKEAAAPLPIEGYCSLLSGCRAVVDGQCALRILKKARRCGPVKSACYTLARQACTLAEDEQGVTTVDAWQKKDGVETHVPTSTVEDPATGERIPFQPGKDGDKQVTRCVKSMIARLKGAGYEPELWQYDPQISPEERADRLQYHTEKKALAWALDRFPPGSCITVRKTIRCCVDCHNAFKIASVAYGRTVRILDQVRMHEFSAGKCSCGDWW